MRILAAFALAVMLSLPALAQITPGSTGGTIGKTGKSVSGGEDAAPPRESAATGISVAGRWRWSASCQSGHYNGAFDLSQTGSGQFTGNFAGTGISDLGSITGGRLDGSVIFFTRNLPLGVTQHWSGRLISGHISGSISGNESCSWQASK